MLPTYDALLPTCGSLPTFVADFPDQLLSPPFQTYYDPTWFCGVAMPPYFPAAIGQFASPEVVVDMAAPSEQPADAGGTSRPSIAVKQELRQDEAFSWWSPLASVSSAECDVEETTIDATVDDYDGTELLEVLADVPHHLISD